MGALQRPSLFGSRSSHSGGVHNDSTLGQLFLNLNACCLIVYTHLLFNKSFRTANDLLEALSAFLIEGGFQWIQFSVFCGWSWWHLLSFLIDFRVSRFSIFVQDKILPYGDKQFFFSYLCPIGTLYANTGWFPWECNNTSQRKNFFWDHFLKELRNQAQLGNQAFWWR